jgi:phage shock protein PspC (stress-responsive transcriptional regulator)
MTEEDKDSGHVWPEPSPAEEPTKAEEPTTEEPKTEPTAQQPAATPRLLRSRSDRVIAGVCGGLGRHLGVDPVIFRITFVLTLFLGGLGVLAYIAAWIFVPSDDETSAEPQPPRLQGVARVVAGILLVLGLLFVLSGLVVVGAFLTAIGWGLVVVALIVLIGIALIAISVTGGSRWLALPALALALGAGAAAAFDFNFEGGIGNRDYRPESAAAIPADGYQLGVGRLAVDLRGIDWSPQRVLPVKVDLGVGQAVIAVPSDVCVVADAHARAGDLQIAGQESSGFDTDSAVGAGSRATPRVEIDADVDLGQIQVLNDDTVDISDGQDFGHRRWEDHSDAMRSANERACAA